MADWATGYGKARPGAKVYLFAGPAGNALDLLVARATAGVHHRYTLRPPLTPDDLGVQLGTPEESQVLIVREIESASDADLGHLLKRLEPPKARGDSLLLVGASLPVTEAAKALRARVSQRGVLVEVGDPAGEVGRRHLVRWVAETWQTTLAAATEACVRADYSVETLVWATPTFRALTSGHPVEGSAAAVRVRLAVPEPAPDETYRLLLGRDPRAVAASRGLTPGQTLGLLRRLESALTDMTLLYPVLNAGQSVSKAADATGMHIARALDLAEWAPRYPPGVALRCRQALALGLEYFTQPEAAVQVAFLWR